MITETAYWAHEIQPLRDAFADDTYEEFSNERLRTIVRRLLVTVEELGKEVARLRGRRYRSLAEAVREVEASDRGETVWIEADLAQIRGLVRERNNLEAEIDRLRETIRQLEERGEDA